MFQIHIKREKGGKAIVEKFQLLNGKNIPNKGEKTDFKWVRAHIAQRAMIIEENIPQYMATFFYSEFKNNRVVIEIGEIQTIEQTEQRKIG